MKMRYGLTVVAVLVLAVAVSASVYAGINPMNKIALHVKAHPTSCTKGYPTFTMCSQIVFTYPGLGDVDVLPVFYELVAYTVAETGLQWPSAWGSASWVRCKGDIAVGGIVNSGDGTAVAWSTCQHTWSIAIGYAWLLATGPGYLCPSRNPATYDYGVVDCAPTPGPYYDYASEISCAGIGGMLGDDACPRACEPGSWGSIKAMFK